MTTANFKKDSIVKVYCLPCSGTAFPNQLGLIAAISKAYTKIRNRNDIPEFLKPSRDEENPDIVMATSGGNLAAYLSLYADWNYDRLYNAIHFVDKEAFMTGWADHTPSWLFLPFSKSVFRPGFGFKSLFTHFFTEGSAKAGAEIWTGTVKKETRKHCVFTNKAVGETLIVPCVVEGEDEVPLILGECEEGAIYLNGDRDRLAEVTLASASIPFLVRPALVGCKYYHDGGAMFSSPLSTLSTQVASLATGPSGKRLRLVYISPSCVTKDAPTLLDFASDISTIVAGNGYMDIRAFLDILGCLGSTNVKTPEHHVCLSPDTLSDLIYSLDSAEPAEVWHYGILVYPSSSTGSFDFSELNNARVLRDMKAAESSLGAFVWRIKRTLL